jgi:phytol kinase
MFGGSFGLALAMLGWFNTLGLFTTPLNLEGTAGVVAAIALVGTMVEALPLRDVDNLTLTGAAVVLGLWLF